MSVTLDEEEVVHGIGADGRPDPEYPRSLGILPAPPGRRSLAFTIDTAFLLILTLPLSLGTFPLWMRAGVELLEQPEALFDNGDFVWGLIFYGIGQLLLMIYLLVQLIMHGRKGITIGKRMVGIRSVNVVRFTKPGFWRMTLRGIVFWASLTIVPLLGAVPFLLSPLWDPEKRGRGWLDRMGGNWLVDIRHGLDPFDTKAMRHARRRLEKPELRPEEQMPSLATGVSGAVPAFIPAARSKSGVISARPAEGDESIHWQPPAIDAPPAPAIATPPPVQSAPPAPAAQSAPRAQSAPAAVAARPGAILEFDGGARVRVVGTGLLGRAPIAPDGEHFEHLLPVDDPSRLISKTHAGFEVDGRGCWFTDRGSVNGVEVTEPGSSARELAPWQRQLLPWGTTVTLGGRTLTLSPDPNPNGSDA